MAVGDIVSGSSAVNTALSFIPALGVEIIITATGAYNAWISLENATGVGHLFTQQTLPYGVNANIKVGINNTNYLNLGAGAIGQQNFYTGIQIK